MFWKFATVTIIVLIQNTFSFPANNENLEINFRLPNNTIPENYAISLRTWIHEGNFSFTGMVTIDILALESTNFITIQQNGLTIGDIRLWSDDVPIPIDQFEYDLTLEFLTIPVPEYLNADQRYKLRIEYNGTLRDDDLGFYRSSYVDDSGVTVWLAGTQFQSISARSAFPSYDEPGIKATFEVDMTHDPSYETLSNMPNISRLQNNDGSVTTYFEKSPPMSAYLVAFVVSDFPYIEGNLTHPTMRVYARPTAINRSRLVAEIGEPMLHRMNDYFGVYYPLPKLDQIALPDFRYGAMENWGLITYLEALFLYDDNSSDYTEKHGVVQTIGHEFAHNWFGNLVTPAWWTDWFLSEGFASYFQNIAVNLVYPDWDMIDYFTVSTIQNVFQSDAFEGSPPINFHLEHPYDVPYLLGLMTSQKAAGIIQMFLHAFSESTFLKGLRIYLNERAYSIASEHDLYHDLEIAVREDASAPSNIDVATVMYSWMSQSGFPLITVERNYEPESNQQLITLSQKRYFADHLPNNMSWWIPLNYATKQHPSFNDTSATNWYPSLESFSFEVSSLNASDWFLLNKQASGYYRVLYDERNYRLLSDEMVENPSRFHRLNRARLVDDTYNFARSGILSYKIFLDLIRFLENDHEYATWHTAVGALSTIDRSFSGHVDYPWFRDFIRQLIEHLYDTVGPRDVRDEPLLRKYARTIAINWACNMGSVHCRSDATRELRAIMISGEEFHQNVRSVLYCAALRSGNANDFNFVWNRMLSANDTATRDLLITAMGCSTTPRLLREFLRSSVSSTNDNEIVYRPGEQIGVFNAVYQSGLLGLEIAVDFMFDNRHEIFYEFGFVTFENIIIGMSHRVSMELRENFTHLLNTVYEENLIADHIPIYANSYMDNNREWLNNNGNEVSSWLRERFL